MFYLCEDFAMPAGTRPVPGPLTIEAAKILRARKAVEKLTDKQLADATGISRSVVNLILNALRQPDVEQLDALCFTLGLDFKAVAAEADQRSAHRKIDWAVQALVKV